jgi:hypothetical protein
VLTGLQKQEQFEIELSRLRAGWTLPGWGGAENKTPAKK